MIELARDAIRWFRRFLLRLAVASHRVDAYLAAQRRDVSEIQDCSSRIDAAETALATEGIQR